MSSQRFASAFGTMIVLSSLADAINYASNLIFGRLLAPSQYGELTALLALVVILTVPTGALQTLIAERLATLRANGDLARVRYLIRYGAAHVLVISVLVSVLYALAIPLVVRVFHVADLGPALATLPLLAVAFFVPFSQGVLQGLERFRIMALMLVVGAASRITFGVPWILFGQGGAGGALGGQALGSALILVVTWWAVRDMHLPRGSGAARAGIRRRLDRRALEASLAFVAFAILSNLDVLLAKAYLRPASSGQYAALITIEKLIMFLPGAVTTIMVPVAAKARASGKPTRVLQISSVVVLACVAVAGIPAAIVPKFVLSTMFGNAYNGAVGGVLPIVIAGGCFGMLYVLVVYTVTVGYRRSTYLMLGMVPVQAAAISVFHHSATQIAVVQGSVILFLLVVNELLFHPLLRRKRGHAEPAASGSGSDRPGSA